jgi:hypothetical protein
MLAYVPAAQSDIRKRIHDFNRRKIVASEARLGRGLVVRTMPLPPSLDDDGTHQGQCA